MWAWLTWLWNQANRVYNIIADFYYRIISAAINAWNWAQSAFKRAIDWAWDKILYYYARAKDFVRARINEVIDFVWYIYNLAVQFCQNLVGDVVDLAWSLWRRAVDAAQALVNGVIDLAWVLYNRAIEAAQDILAGVLGIIAATVEQAYQALIAIINGVIDTFDATLKRAGIVDEQSEGQLRLFLTNPLEYFAAYLVSILLTALAYTVAYALGAVEATLPPPPEWSDNGAGGPYPPGPGLLPGASPLAPPLTHLRRSGHPYSPSHRGADFGCTQDMKVYACHDGKVLVAGWSNVGYGYYVVISNNEWWSLYAHLLPPIVATGQNVSARQVIGTCDTTGNSTGNHLHLELKHYGSFVSPYTVFGVEG